MYILIYALVASYPVSSSTGNVQFANQKACETARAQLIEAMPSQSREKMTLAVCVSYNEAH
jgi:hypothetical protein